MVTVEMEKRLKQRSIEKCIDIVPRKVVPIQRERVKWKDTKK